MLSLNNLSQSRCALIKSLSIVVVNHFSCDSSVEGQAQQAQHLTADGCMTLPASPDNNNLHISFQLSRLSRYIHVHGRHLHE